MKIKYLTGFETMTHLLLMLKQSKQSWFTPHHEECENKLSFIGGAMLWSWINYSIPFSLQWFLLKALSCESRTGTPWELLYADDRVISAETEGAQNEAE